jgi:hypothetical protein
VVKSTIGTALAVPSARTPAVTLMLSALVASVNDATESRSPSHGRLEVDPVSPIDN